ncbi:MAG TPA: insulinase family protein, partial [Pyrinomonadaceae bacterium]
MKRMLVSISLATLLAFSTAGISMASNINAAVAPAPVLLPNRSPLVSFRILFMTGAASDPKGKEGVANLTAAMLAGGGSRQMTYEQITEAFYPMAAGFRTQVDKEMTVFTGTTHVDNLARYYDIIRQMLLDPGFRQDDFTRNKADTINYLKTGLRQNNDEELGKEYLYNVIYAGTPYAHNTAGTISSLERLTLDDVRAFYRENYTQANLVVGMSGGFDTKFSNQMNADFRKLPKGAKQARRIP